MRRQIFFWVNSKSLSSISDTRQTNPELFFRELICPFHLLLNAFDFSHFYLFSWWGGRWFSYFSTCSFVSFMMEVQTEKSLKLNANSKQIMEVICFSHKMNLFCVDFLKSLKILERSWLILFLSDTKNLKALLKSVPIDLHFILIFNLYRETFSLPCHPRKNFSI